MEQKQKTKKPSTYKIIFSVIVICFLILLLAFSLVGLIDQKELSYYKSQTNSLCSIANDYRNMTLTIKPEYTNRLPPEINCTQIMLEK